MTILGRALCRCPAFGPRQSVEQPLLANVIEIDHLQLELRGVLIERQVARQQDKRLLFDGDTERCIGDSESIVHWAFNNLGRGQADLRCRLREARQVAKGAGVPRIIQPIEQIRGLGHDMWRGAYPAELLNQLVKPQDIVIDILSGSLETLDFANAKRADDHDRQQIGIDQESLRR